MIFTLIKPNVTPLPGYVREPLQMVLPALSMNMLWQVFIRCTRPLNGFAELSAQKVIPPIHMLHSYSVS